MKIHVIDLAIAIVISMIMVVSGYGLNTWQWWAVVLLGETRYMLGRMKELKEKNND